MRIDRIAFGFAAELGKHCREFSKGRLNAMAKFTRPLRENATQNGNPFLTLDLKSPFESVERPANQKLKIGNLLP